MNDPRALPTKEFWLLSAAGFASLFGVWTAVAVSGAVPAQFLPTPWAVVDRIVELTQKPFVGFTLQQHLWSSVLRYLLGFGLAAAVGVPLGLLMGWFRWLDQIVSPLFEGIRFIAPIAWVPFAALWFGTGIGGPTLIIFMGAFPPALINAYRGAKFVEPRFIEAAQTLARPTGASSSKCCCRHRCRRSWPVCASARDLAGNRWSAPS